MPVPKASKAPNSKAPTPKLVNRGGFGLLHKKKRTGGELVPAPEVRAAEKKKGKHTTVVTVAKHRITPAIQHLAVPIDGLTFDPANARLHPKDNKEAIKASLTTWGQTKPIVVNKNTNVIVAGNGTCQCAKELGWTEIAVSFVDMTDAEAAAYGIADNRTAELARWDEATLKKLTLIAEQANQPMLGWTLDELEVLRAASWVPPQETDEVFGTTDVKYTLRLTEEQKTCFDIVIQLVKQREGNKKLTDPECLTIALTEWTPKPKYETV